MKSRLILPVMVALLASETFAGNLPSTGASASNGIPASPHQVQVLGLSKLRGTEDGRFSYTRKGLVNTYNGLPVSRHQLEVYGFRSKLAVLPSVTTEIAIGADSADPALDRVVAIEGFSEENSEALRDGTPLPNPKLNALRDTAEIWFDSLEGMRAVFASRTYQEQVFR